MHTFIFQIFVNTGIKSFRSLVGIRFWSKASMFTQLVHTPLQHKAVHIEHT